MLLLLEGFLLRSEPDAEAAAAAVEDELLAGVSSCPAATAFILDIRRSLVASAHNCACTAN